MPPQTIALALGASIYPPAVAAVIAFGRGSEVRSRVFAFVLAAALATYASGVLTLFVLSDLGATGAHHRTPSAALDLALGVALIGLAVYLRHRWRTPRAGGGQPKIERYLQSRRLAFVLGVVLYGLPSPVYLGAVKGIADAKLSTGNKLAALALTVVVMLWLIELPMLMLVLVPDRALSTLERTNAWFGRHGRQLVILVCCGAGAYLILHGLLDLPG
jgi:Sap, sulfolipid-1-addressing protein